MTTFEPSIMLPSGDRQANRPGRMRKLLAGLLVAMLGFGGCRPDTGDLPPLPTVAHVDLDRYQGTWYEIARIPNRFQEQCAGNTTAEYSLRDDGRLNVINRCNTFEGELDEARGVARIVDTASNARLKVSFVSLLGWQLFWGDYWVTDLAADYSYVVVGTPGRQYGWILSRTPTLPASVRTLIDQGLSQRGYAPEHFEDTDQNPPTH
ncbi:lipocalin family protein [Thiogranum longum]|jgi:apolipoprotein D and lipocalin family protein